MTDNNNNFFSLPETTSDNETYNNAVAAKQQLETQIRNEQAMPAASAETLAGYETIIKNYDTIMRVEGNKLHKVQISNLEFTAAAALSEDELASTALTLITPRGTWFDNTNSTVDIQAQVRVKGKNIDVNSQQLAYY